MMKYSEITLTDEEKKILEWFKDQEYTDIFRKDDYDRIAFYDGSTGTEYITSIRNKFYFINVGEYYEIDKLLNPLHEPKTVLELKKGDIFWYVTLFGEVKSETWNELTIDRDMRSQGNAFLTKEEAEFESKRREVVTKVQKYARPFECGDENWYPYWACNYKEINFSNSVSVKWPIDYFESNASIQKAIAEVGDDDFKKYYLGVI